MFNDDTDEIIEKLFNHVSPGVKLVWKHQLKLVILYLIVFIIGAMK